MNKYIKFIFFGLLLLVPMMTIFKESKHDRQQCRMLEDSAKTVFTDINELFGTDYRLTFIDSVPDSGDVLRPAHLLDSNSRIKDVIQLALPCQIPQDKLPSKELYLFILAHEYAHKIIDSDSRDCEFEYSLSLRPWEVSNPKFVVGESIHHNNVDILALKILSKLGIDQLKAYKDLEENLSFPKVLSEMEAILFKTRLEQVKKVIPTDFSEAGDFFRGGFIAKMDVLDKFSEKLDNTSKFKKDIYNVFSERRSNCYFVPLNQQEDTAMKYYKLIEKRPKENQ